MFKYSRIEQFRHAVYNINKGFRAGYHGNVVSFEGTVKLHGTNGGIVFDENGWHCQGRNRDVTVEKDNMGFAFAMQGLDKYWNNFRKVIFREYGFGTYVVYGEWCGKGIQKGIALTELEKMFVVFDIKLIVKGDENPNLYVDDNKWMHLDKLFIDNGNCIHSIYEAPTYHINIDCIRGDIAIEELTRLTAEVENECPFAKLFGVSGIGEGIVWKNREHGYKFKTKGEKHSQSKVTKIPKVQLTAEEYATREAFVEAVITDRRVEQGVEYLNEMGHPVAMTSFSHLLKWVIVDVIKEEYDTMIASNIDNSQLGKFLPNYIRVKFMKNHVGI